MSKPRKLNLFYATSLGILLLLAIALAAAPALVGRTLSSWLHTYNDSPSSVGEISINWWNGSIRIEDIKSGNSKVKSVYLSWVWKDLFDRHLHIDDLRIKGLQLSAVHTRKGWRIDQYLLQPSEPGPHRWTFTIDKLELHHCQLEADYRNHAWPATIRRLVIDNPLQPVPDHRFSVDMQLGEQNINIEGDWQDEDQQVFLINLDAQFDLFWLDSLDIAPLAGVLNLNGQLSLSRDEQRQWQLHYKGSLDSETFSYSDEPLQLDIEHPRWDGELHWSNALGLSAQGKLLAENLRLRQNTVTLLAQQALWQGELRRPDHQLHIEGSTQLASLDLKTGTQHIQAQDLMWNGSFDADEQWHGRGQLSGAKLVLANDRPLLTLKGWSVEELEFKPELYNAALVEISEVQLPGNPGWQFTDNSIRLPLVDMATHDVRIGEITSRASLIVEAGAPLPNLLSGKDKDPNTDSKLPWRLAVDKLTTTPASELRYHDPSARWQINLQPLVVEAWDLANHDQHKSRFRITTDINESGGHIVLRGESQRIGQDYHSTFNAEVGQLELMAFSPLLQKLKAYSVRSGQMNLVLEGKLEGQQLQSQGQLQLRKLELKKEAASTAGEVENLTVDQMLSLTKNNKGDIDLAIQINGPLDKLNFQQDGLTNQALYKALKLAMAQYYEPLGLISASAALAQSLLRPQFKAITFIAGSIEPDRNGRKMLSKLGQAMLEKPALEVRLCGYAVAADAVPQSQLATDEKRLELANQRAAMIKQKLIEIGVGSERLFLCAGQQDKDMPRVEVRL